MIHLKCIWTLCVLLTLHACNNESQPEPPPTPPALITFHSSFEAGVTVVETGLLKCSGDILGSDGSENGHWESDLEAPPVESVDVCYGGDDDSAKAGGDVEQRGINLVQDPDDPGNTVLHTWVAEPAENVAGPGGNNDTKDKDDEACSCFDRIDAQGQECSNLPQNDQGEYLDGFDENGSRKGRVQMSIYAEEGSPFSNFTYSVRLRLSEAYRAIEEDYPQKLEWMTIGEYWNKGPSIIQKGDRARVTLNLVKENANAALHFGLKMDIQPDGENDWELIWPDETTKHLVSEEPAPIEEWFTLKVTMVAGDESSGHTTIDIIRENGISDRIFDVVGATLYPNTLVPGFTSISPIKLYTSGNMVCWLKQQGLAMDAHWDDFSFSIHSDE